MSKKKYIVFWMQIWILIAICAFQKPVYATEADIEIEMEEQEVKKATVSQMSVKVYYDMDEESAVLANVLQGSEITILKTESNDIGEIWHLICTDTGVEGYIREAVAPQGVEGATKQLVVRQINFAQNVNIREYPSTESSVVGRVPIYTILTSHAEEYNEEGELWYQIEYEGAVGYIRESTVDVLEDIEESSDDMEEFQGQETASLPVINSSTQKTTEDKKEDLDENEKNNIAKDEEVDAETSKPLVTTRADAGLVDEVTIMMVIGMVVSLLMAGIAMIFVYKERKYLQQSKKSKKGKSKYRIDRKG